MNRDANQTGKMNPCDHIGRVDIIADYVHWCRRCGSYRITKAGIDWTRPLNEIDPKAPLPELKGTFPVVLYFATAKDADELVAAVKAEKPNMKARFL